MARKVYRSKTNRMLGGVCGGLADYFNVDVVLIRLLLVFAFLAGGIGLLAYLIAWIIIPEEGSGHLGSTVNGSQESDEGFPKPQQAFDRQGQVVIGLIAILIGFFLLIRQFVPFFPWHTIWPIVIILIGIAIMLGGFAGKGR